MIRITSILGNHHGSVDTADRDRAVAAAAAACDAAGIHPDDAAAAYRSQWLVREDESLMSGPALVWITARAAADVALTATWADPTAEVFCELDAWP